MEDFLGVDAADPPRDLPAETVADRNHPGGVSHKHLDTTWTSLRSDSIGGIKKSRQALLPPRAASAGRRARSPWLGSFTPESEPVRNHNL